MLTAHRVLCVDLDGTLIATDLLWESLLSAARNRPWTLLAIPFWLLRGRSYLKRRLAEAAAVDFATLPYRREVVSFVESEHRRGRQVVLATASDLLLAKGVSRHLGLFAEVLASDGVVNLKGRVKAASLVRRFGAGNYDYVGDSRADRPCWAAAADAITTGARVSDVAHLRALHRPERAVFRQAALVARALRPYQWVKNLLLAVPAAAAHTLDVGIASTLLLAFVSLSLCASGGYVLNDLLDLASDRRHPRKRHRPFASGELSLSTGAALVMTTWLAGFGIAAAMLPPSFALVAAIYLVSTAAYSLRLKREPVLDVMFLAGLYVTRVIAGGVATGVAVSTWLLAFTLFVCLSLAFLKRFVEVSAKPAAGGGAVAGRGYMADDAQWLQSAGLASAYLSVVILAIYVNNANISGLYSHPDRLLLLCPVLLYWATRTWLKAHRRRIHDDPVIAVAVDPVTYVVIALSMAVVLAAV